MSLPVEITNCYTDIGHPLYEWVCSGYCYDMRFYQYYMSPINMRIFKLV